ncbi:related to pxr1 [Lecanosticta acicola]|uniref:PinX1-related protein 1 n=1 Tax=Lecanosticta acicola TaxID=111012 RepID=A0AAI8YYZ5_9PEZI|nr:related to pxr1 [Lecanosticta acicola]
MGLSGVKKRSKLSHDPNNTAWSKSTTNFGHKILSKQGWKPGDYLGAENATHSEHYTAANASHIRVMLREDNLGLGAKIGGGNAETFGLSMFSGLLGRLNGKSEVELKEKQDQMRDAELRTWTGRKYGYMNFVSGGLLVGDKMEEKTVTTKSGGSSKKRKAEEEAVEEITQQEKKNKKRKSEPDQTTAPDSAGAEKVKKSSKKDNKNGDAGRNVSVGPVQDDTESGPQAEDMAREEKRKRKERRRAEKASKVTKASSEDEEKARLQEEKRARKEERRKRKEEKRQKRAAKEQATVQPSTSRSESEGTATPPVQANIGGRQAVRQRYIQSKRMASMDPQALKEIFMLQTKTPA